MMANDRNREASLWMWLKNHFKELAPHKHHIQRIENSCAKGTPDVEGCVAGGQFWCELKVAYEMKGDKIRVKITADQVRTAMRRERAGGHSWVLVRVCGATWRENKHYLIPGRLSEDLLIPQPRSHLEFLSACQPHAAAVEIIKIMGRV
jgi:hypothetical protein